METKIQVKNTQVKKSKLVRFFSRVAPNEVGEIDQNVLHAIFSTSFLYLLEIVPIPNALWPFTMTNFIFKL